MFLVSVSTGKYFKGEGVRLKILTICCREKLFIYRRRLTHHRINISEASSELAIMFAVELGIKCCMNILD